MNIFSCIFLLCTFSLSRAQELVTISRSSATPMEGSQYTLTCNANRLQFLFPNGPPRWRKNSIIIEGQTSSTLTFNPIDRNDTGNYTCEVPYVHLEGGTYLLTATASVEVMVPLPAPPAISTSSGSRSVTVMWTQPTGGLVDSYILEYNANVIGCSNVPPQMGNSILDGAKRMFVVSNLPEHSSVSGFIRAVNIRGNVSALFSGSTLPAVASSGPRQLILTSGVTNVSIQWNEVDCEERNGNITGYIVQWGLSSSSLLTNSTTEGKTLTIDGLQIRADYSVQVAAINEQGIGEYSTSETFSTMVPRELGFYLNGDLHPNNSVVSIADIGVGTGALYCITDREQCCRETDGGASGEWYLPRQTIPVNGNGENSVEDFSQSRMPSAVLLHRRNNATSPAGLYRCEIQDSGGSFQTLFVVLRNENGGIVSVTGNRVFLVEETINLTCSAQIPVRFLQWTDELNRVLITETQEQELSLTINAASANNSRYTCTAISNDGQLMESQTTTISVVVVNAEVEESSNPMEGSEYILTCVLSGHQSLMATVMYQWFNNSNLLQGQTRERLIFNSVSRYDNGTYSCQVSIHSPLINYTVSRQSMFNLQVTVPLPTQPLVEVTNVNTRSTTISWMLQPGGIVDSYTVEYTATVRGCSEILEQHESQTLSRASTSLEITGLEEDSTVTGTVAAVNIIGMAVGIFTTNTLTARPGVVRNVRSSNVTFSSITLTWDELSCVDYNGPFNGYIIQYGISTFENSTNITIDATFTHYELSPLTTYIYRVAAISEDLTGPYTAISVRTDFPSGAALRWNGHLLPNQSIVGLEEIIGGLDLFCLTNTDMCCTEQGEAGFWYFPDGTTIPRNTSGVGYRREEGLVALMYSGMSTPPPSGLYRCEIQDSSGGTVILFAGIYDNELGVPTITSPIEYLAESNTLTCVSSGGPATEVTWTKDNTSVSLSLGTQQQYLIDAATSTYHSLLTITSNNIRDYGGTFSCTVSNSRGQSTTQLVDLKGVKITGNRVFQLGEVIQIMCATPFPVPSMLWTSVNESSIEVNRGSAIQRLSLALIISPSSHNTWYKCAANDSEGFYIAETINIQVGDEQSPRLPNEVQATATQVAITISWSFPITLPSKNETFAVVYGAVPGQLTMTSLPAISRPGTQIFTANLLSLQPGTRYYFKIQSTNNFGYTVTDAVEHNIKTMDARSSAVQAMEIAALNNASLTITWLPPAFSNGDILYYVVEVSLFGSDEAVQEENVFGTMLNAFNLSAGIPYSISVLAVNLAGPGALVFATRFTQELAPDVPPGNFRAMRPSGSTMDLSWDPLTLIEARGIIAAYTISYKQLSNGSSQVDEEQTVTTRDNGTMVSGLQEDAAYLVQVWGNTAGGAGRRSQELVVRAPPDSTTSVGGSEGTTWVIVGASVAGLVVLTFIVIAIAVVARNRKRCHRTRRPGKKPDVYSMPDGNSMYEEIENFGESTIKNAVYSEAFDIDLCAAYAEAKNKFDMGTCPAYIEAKNNFDMETCAAYADVNATANLT